MTGAGRGRIHQIAAHQPFEPACFVGSSLGERMPQSGPGPPPRHLPSASGRVAFYSQGADVSTGAKVDYKGGENRI